MRKTFFILIFAFFLQYSFSQIKQINRYEYGYNETVLFEDLDTIIRKKLNKDTTIVYQIEPIKVHYMDENKDRFIYLGNNYKLFFISSRDNIPYILKKVTEIIKDVNGNKLFPRDFLVNDLNKDGCNEVIVKFIDPEGPVFRIIVFSWIDNNVQMVCESDNLFKYPSWNPLIEEKSIEVSNNQITIPYCIGCQSGSDGREGQLLLFFDFQEKTYKFLYKK